jgi:hypothetical protein
MVRADGLSVWLHGSQGMTSDDSLEHIGARLGYRIGDDERIEIGLSSEYYPGADDADSPQVWGVYGLYHWPDAIKVPQPIPLEFLPAELTATPYIGGRIGLDFDADGVVSGPVAGIIVNEVIFFEAQYNYYGGPLEGSGSDDFRFIFGLRFALP